LAVQAAVRASISVIPTQPGVYRFRDGQDRVLYVGRAVNLRRRVASYWGDLRDRRHLARMVAAIERIDVAVCDSEHEAAWLERNVLERRKPRANRTRGGQESPVLIRLDTSAATPGLKPVYQPRQATGIEHFGPYLGGQKVRLAIAGLHRAFSLSYAGDTLTGAEREMARIRRVAPGRRADLVAEVRAVLHREPAAVESMRAVLTARRQAAVDELAFEAAGRVQAELEAVEWVMSTQRVTTSDGADLDIHGWQDGLLVSFAIRAGRMHDWRQRACRAERAGPLLAATPPAWRDFAQRNAELAVRLRATSAQAAPLGEEAVAEPP
jgi:excinuclease ABC subunit C